MLIMELLPDQSDQLPSFSCTPSSGCFVPWQLMQRLGQVNQVSLRPGGLSS
jgi:hypothetical protein